jgi:hypothetical protein
MHVLKVLSEGPAMSVRELPSQTRTVEFSPAMRARSGEGEAPPPKVTDLSPEVGVPGTGMLSKVPEAL